MASLRSYARLRVGRDAVEEVLLGQLGRAAEVLGRERDRVDAAEADDHAFEVPLLGVPLAGVGLDDAPDGLVGPLADVVRDVGALEHLAALRVDDLALLVQHVVVLEHVLADLEVLLLDPALGALDAVRQHLRVDRLALRRPHAGRGSCRSGRRRTGARGRPRPTGRSASRPRRPGGRSGRGAGCRCGATRAARCRARRGRRPRGTPSPSLMSTPRPAMFVAIVTAPRGRRP